MSLYFKNSELYSEEFITSKIDGVIQSEISSFKKSKPLNVTRNDHKRVFTAMQLVVLMKNLQVSCLFKSLFWDEVVKSKSCYTLLWSTIPHKICSLFYVSVYFPFTTNDMKLDCYDQKLNVPVAEPLITLGKSQSWVHA